MAITLNQSITGAVNSRMEMGGGVELPFPTVYFWWSNGDPRNARLAQQAPVSYFGGWTCKQNEMEMACQSNQANRPTGLYADMLTPMNGGAPFEVYQSRQLIAAPIAVRQQWRETNGTGARSHTQLLAYLASKEDNGQFMPWGPVVLSVKSFQSKHLTTAIKDWQRHIATGLRTFAPGVPAWFFYCALGSFGATPVNLTVGKGETRQINPIKAFLPAVVDEALLTLLFVGEQVAAHMADLGERASDWLDAWKKEEKKPEDYPDAYPDEDDAPFVVPPDVF